MFLQPSVSRFSKTKLQLNHSKNMFNFGAYRGFLMLTAFDLCLGACGVLLTLAGTAIDFVVERPLPYRFWGSSAIIQICPGSVPRRRDNILQGRPKGCLAGHSAGKGCLSGICRGRKTQNQYSSRLCREGTCFHGIAVPPYWFHSYIFEIVTIVVYWFCGRGKRPVPTVESWRCSLMPQCFVRPFS